MRVWVIQTGELLPHVHPEARPMRAANVAFALRAAGHEVVLWSSDFIHQLGSHTYGANTVLRPEPGLELRLVRSPGYSRNIGLGRIRDHTQFSQRLLRLMRREPLPEVAFVGFPPMEAAAVTTNLLARHGVPTLLDVKDQWPEVFVRPIPELLRPAGRVALWPYSKLAQHTMQTATGISSISPEFLDWSLSVAHRARRPADLVLPLTSRPAEVSPTQVRAAEQWWDSVGVRNDGQFRAAYVGSINSGLHVEDIIAAARATTVQFVICGDGPRREYLRDQVADLPNVVVPGWVDQVQGEVLYRRSSVSLAPYIDEAGFGLGIPNKMYDSLRHGLPIITSIRGVVARLVTTHNVGIYYGEATEGGLGIELMALADDPERLASMAQAAQDLYAQQYSFDRVYGGLVDHLEAMVSGSLAKKRTEDV